MGHPLSQTLFTSLYVERIVWPEPKVLDQASFTHEGAPEGVNPLLHVVLRAYCLLLIKTCGLVFDTINNEAFYEVG